MIDNATLDVTTLDPSIDTGGLEQNLGYALRRAQLAVFDDFHRSLAHEDIRTAQYSVLLILRHNPGLRQNQVSAALGIKTANFVPLLDGLERRGLAERRLILTDRRAKRLFLTSLGHTTLTRLEDLVNAHDARVAARIGLEGKRTLLALLHNLSEGA